MRTGKLAISRGHELIERTAPHLAAVPPALPEAPPPLPLHPEIDERLTALERLARLFEQGALAPQEFVAEKALILGRYGDERALARLAPVSFVPVQPPPPRRRPSLLGRLLGWPLLALGLAAGLGFSFATQPAETANFFRDLASLAGF